MASHFDHLEQAVAKKYSRHDKKKKPKMKVSGKSVLAIKKVIIAKSKSE